MKKLSVIFVLAFLCSESFAQSRVALPLTGWRYPNANRPTHSVGDTVSNSADTLSFGILGKGGLMPVAVTVSYLAADADVSATPDSLQVTYRAGVGGIYTTVIADTVQSVPGTASTRTLVMNTTGASSARNTQAAVFPHCDAIQLWIKDGSLATNDTISYRIRVFGIYEQGPGAVYAIPLEGWRYGNGKTVYHATGDSLVNATQDSLTIGLTVGDLAPTAVALALEFKGVGGTKDSAQVTYQMGNQEFYTTVGSNQNEAVSVTTAGFTVLRDLVFNTTGAAAAINTQGVVAPHGRSLRMFLKQASNDSETISYRARALGVYRKN